ncbi:TPA: FliM/FliN family flagellar motor switch protein [Yersinia enterocolitica]
MRIKIDIVVADCTMTLDELTHLQNGQIKSLTNFVQSEVLLKSGSEIIATGILVKVDEQFCVAIDQINNIAK